MSYFHVSADIFSRITCWTFWDKFFVVLRIHIVSEVLVHFGTKYETVRRFDQSTTDIGHNYLNVLRISVVDRPKRPIVSWSVLKNVIYLLLIYWNCSILKHELKENSIRVNSEYKVRIWKGEYHFIWYSKIFAFTCTSTTEKDCRPT